MTRQQRKQAGTDPRRAGGTIAGPGGPHERNGVVIDATDAVLMDSCTVAIVDPLKGGVRVTDNPAWVLNLAGRINKRQERADIAFLFDADGAAAIITELIAIAARQGPEVHAELMANIARRTQQLRKDGNL